MPLTAADIFNALKKKIYTPVYFFFGEEPFYIDELTAYIEQHVLDETLRDLNQTVVYGLDVSALDVVDLARRFPMMADYQVVIVKEAQNITNFEPLLTYIENPSRSTLLVINYKHRKLDKRKTLYKRLSKSKEVTLFESAKVYDNKIPAWISERVKLLGFTITPKAEMMLAEFLGADLSRIANELNKLVINLTPGEQITENLVEQNIGISKDFNVFELQNALGRKDLYQALRIVQYFEANPKQNPIQMVNVLLFGYFMKILLYHQLKNKDGGTIASKLGIHRFFLGDYRTAAQNYTPDKIKSIIAGLRRVDLKSKGLGTVEGSTYGPLKEWLFEVIN
jgi:DNA polymerase-3 subunit delta